MGVPAWLVVGVLVTLPDLDRHTGKRYRVVHVEFSELVATGIEVGVQPVDAPEYKQPKCVSMNHCERLESVSASDRPLPRFLA